VCLMVVRRVHRVESLLPSSVPKVHHNILLPNLCLVPKQCQRVPFSLGRQDRVVRRHGREQQENDCVSGIVSEPVSGQPPDWLNECVQCRLWPAHSVQFGHHG
jgi:hypothetical protein